MGAMAITLAVVIALLFPPPQTTGAVSGQVVWADGPASPGTRVSAISIREPWFGTWRLNLENSTFKRATTKIEPWQDGLKVTYDLVGTRGGVTHMEWTGKFDGKDYPVQGVDYVLTNAYSRIDDHHYEITTKIDGAVTTVAKVEISSDSKTLTTLTTGTTVQGQTVTTTTIYTRQQ